MKIALICALALITSVLAGCGDSPGPITRAAFGPERTYAVVTIHAHRLIRGDAPDSLTGLVGALISSDAAYLSNANSVLQESVPMIVDGFGRASSYRLMPASQVLNHPAYAAIAADTQSNRRIVADGYKYFEDPIRLGRLATELGVDGVAVVSVEYRFKFDGANYGRLVASGVTLPEIIMEVVFRDRSGEVVWQDDITHVGDYGPPSPHGDTANFDLLRPHLVEASTLTARSLSVAVDRRLGAAATMR